MNIVFRFSIKNMITACHYLTVGILVIYVKLSSDFFHKDFLFIKSPYDEGCTGRIQVKQTRDFLSNY